jgi:hypothetical protein
MLFPTRKLIIQDGDVFGDIYANHSVAITFGLTVTDSREVHRTVALLRRHGLLTENLFRGSLTSPMVQFQSLSL